jgi:hypothetical protein
MAMANLFSAMSVPKLARLARRTALVAALIGVAGLAVSLVVSHALFGVGLCLGLAMALGNFRFIARSTAKAAASGRRHKRPLVGNTLARLGVISAVCLVLAWLVGPLGFGAIVGLALFQFVMVVNVVLSLLRDPVLGDAALGDPGRE